MPKNLTPKQAFMSRTNWIILALFAALTAVVHDPQTMMQIHEHYPAAFDLISTAALIAGVLARSMPKQGDDA